MHMNRLPGSLIGVIVVICVIIAAAAVVGQEAWNGKLVQYGTMHQAVGQQHSEGRVALADMSATPHFYGVAALEGLKGEVTFFDSSPIVTAVGADRKLSAPDGKELKATLLVGANVPSWRPHAIEQDVSPAEFDKTVHDAASGAKIDTATPFVFTAEGEFSDVRMHVINGACPMHARKQNVEIPDEQKPFEGEYPGIRGRIVGIYAENAVGKLTHPGTSTHVHLIFKDEASGTMITGHVESIGVVKGTTLNLPQ